MWLNTPGDGMPFVYLHPTDNVRLAAALAYGLVPRRGLKYDGCEIAYLAMNLQLL